MQKILVIKLRHHGDVLLTTALYRALHDQFPGAQVDTLIYKETSPLLQNNPHLHKVLCIDRKLKGLNRLKAEFRLIRQIRQTNYDSVIHLTDQWIGAAIAHFSKALTRIEMVHAKRDKVLWHACFTHQIVPPARGQAHAIELNLLCLQSLGINPETIQGEMALCPSAENQEKTTLLLKQNGIEKPFVLIHPAARWPFKCWENERFSDVVVHLLEKGLNVMLTCSPDPIEITMTAEIEKLALGKYSGDQAKLVNLGGKISLPMLAALLQQSKFYVGVDSAPMHMAAALNIPQVALFGPSWLQEWRPWSSRATVIYAGDFGPLPHPDSINTDDKTRLLSAIPTGVVIQAVDHLI